MNLPFTNVQAQPNPATSSTSQTFRAAGRWLQTQHVEDIIGVLVDAGFAAFLQSKEQFTAMRLGCGPRMAEAILQVHGTLHVVLPAAADGQELPEADWLAGLYTNFKQPSTCTSRVMVSLNRPGHPNVWQPDLHQT